MAEGAALEMLYTGNRIGGSNPPLSALKGDSTLVGSPILFLDQKGRGIQVISILTEGANPNAADGDRSGRKKALRVSGAGVSRCGLEWSRYCVAASLHGAVS